jgi:Protein of unknown function (DUF2934)
MSASATTKPPPPRKKNAAAAAQPEPEKIVEKIMPEPETIMPDRNARIRELAYFLWLEEGCPEGQEERHWLAAEALLESDPLERKRVEGEPPGEPA